LRAEHRSEKPVTIVWGPVVDGKTLYHLKISKSATSSHKHDSIHKDFLAAKPDPKFYNEFGMCKSYKLYRYIYLTLKSA
jgi:hypothetical protein